MIIVENHASWVPRVYLNKVSETWTLKSNNKLLKPDTENIFVELTSHNVLLGYHKFAVGINYHNQPNF